MKSRNIILIKFIMNKSGSDQTKENTKIRRELNRHHRRISRQVLNFTKDDSNLPNFKNTSGWVSW
jgi:hypothetical protein